MTAFLLTIKFNVKHKLYQECQHGENGFTLVEILVVIVILSVFAGMLTLSAGSSESRKNWAFYEHLQGSLRHLRLVSSERMQPMGLKVTTSANGQTQLQVVSLTDPYAQFGKNLADLRADKPKNSMELSNFDDNTTTTTPSWQSVDIKMPDVPANVSIHFASLDAAVSISQQMGQVQPWFTGSDVPEVLWFGTGEASPVLIEVRYQDKLIGNAIEVTPDGRVKVGDES